MKRCVAMCLITMLMLSIALVVHGENQSVTVKYSIAETCSLSIPDIVPMSSSGASFEMTCSKNSDKRVAVSVSSQNFFQLKNSEFDTPIHYRILCDGTPLPAAGEAFKVFEMNNDSCQISFAMIGDVSSLPAGDYIDRLTFTMTYLD